jgi:hypothetical protein
VEARVFLVDEKFHGLLGVCMGLAPRVEVSSSCYLSFHQHGYAHGRA